MEILKGKKLTKDKAEALAKNNSLLESTRIVGNAKIMYPYQTPNYTEPASRGRKIKYKNIVVLRKKIKEYFEDCDVNQKPYTMSGFALFLGISRATLLKYQQEDERYEEAIEEAKTKIESFAEARLFDKNSSGAMFALKNNFPSWKEEKETVVKGPLGSILDQINDQTQKLVRD